MLQDQLTESEKEFLISFKLGDPNWDLMPISHVKELPRVKWKLLNIRSMDKNKHKNMLSKLREILK